MKITRRNAVKVTRQNAMKEMYEASLGKHNLLASEYEAKNEIIDRGATASSRVIVLLKHLKRCTLNNGTEEHCLIRANLQHLKVTYENHLKIQSEELMKFQYWVNTLENLLLDLCKAVYKCDSSNRSDIQYYYEDTLMKMNNLDEESKVELVTKLEEAQGLSEIKVIISSKVLDIKIKEIENEIKQSKKKSKNIFHKIFRMTKDFFSFHCISDLNLSDLDSDPEVLHQDLQYLLKQKEMYELFMFHQG